MGILAVVGLIIIAGGILGLLHVLSIGLSTSVIAIVVGLLLVFFGGGISSRLR